MPKEEDKQHLEHIAEKMRNPRGKVALFLGAGASIGAGAPSGIRLRELIKAEFKNIDQSLTDFIEVCQDVIDTPPYNRKDLEDFIKDKLFALNPTKEHKLLPNYNFACIFTTNFDDLIESAYREPTVLRPCIPVYTDTFKVDLSDKDKIYLFKIMGSITATEGETGQIILSRSDYNRALRRRREYLELLSDFVKDGIIVFIGYSFYDHLALDVIDDLIDIYGIERVPWSFALFDKINMDEKSRYKLELRKIIPIEISFEEFIGYLEETDTIVFKEKTRTIPIKIGEYILNVESEALKQCSEYFEVLTESKILEAAGSKDDFFKGINNSWGAFKEVWDFRRDVYTNSDFLRIINGKRQIGCIKGRIFEEIKDYNTESNKIILVTGMAGVGKTMLLRRLAYDVYKGGYGPIIIIKSSKMNFDYKMLTSFIENMSDRINQLFPDGTHKSPLKPVILIDDAASFIRHIDRLKTYLTSRSKSALIVVSERKNEWEVMLSKFPIRISDENTYELDEQLTDLEKVRIIDHFSDLGYIIKGQTFWEDMIEQEFKNSLFATIYSLVNPAKKPLNDIIRDQYCGLPEKVQEAFKYICILHQFNISINMELLVRSLRCTYDDFFAEIIAKDSEKVIFEEEDEYNNIIYRTHHRIIAQKTVEFFFGDPQEQKEIFQKILSSSVLTIRKERENIEELLIEYIGPNSKTHILSLEQQKDLFETICDKYPLRSLVHHWGILEMQDENFREAETLLNKALKLPKGDMESYRGESDQNILTSLGNLYAKMGKKFYLSRDFKQYEECFDKAEECFKMAKHGDYPNAFAYHAHTNMWYKKGNDSLEESEKLNCYAKCLEIISTAKDNLNEDDLNMLYELETSIWIQIGDKDKISRNIEILRDKYDDAAGYRLYAEFYIKKSEEKRSPDEERRCLEEAMKEIVEGLTNYPHDEACLRLKAKLVQKICPADIYECYKSLRDWKLVASTPNASLLYELGRISFVLEYYDASKTYFRELETGIGIGHRLRFRPRHPILNDSGSRRDFEGSIIKIYTYDEGEIRCETLRNLKYPLSFRPIACKFTPVVGDRVRFHISFTYRGPRAENVRKI